MARIESVSPASTPFFEEARAGKPVLGARPLRETLLAILQSSEKPVLLFRIDDYLSGLVALSKRPACVFAAFARVSNQSAISAKPSSRAVLAIPGYMSVYS
jgi:hypothetical protein